MQIFEAHVMKYTTLVNRLAFALAFAVIVLGGSYKSALATEFLSPEDAEQHGVSAYKGGYYNLALPALTFASNHDKFHAKFFLAELYADNNSVHTDHAKAFDLFLTIANAHANVDPYDRSRAPFVAQALTSLARYYNRGVPKLSIEPDPKRAANYLHHAAIFFNHEDAQFELAKLYLKGEGVEEDEAKGKHWLATLAKKGHAGAQAFLADLHWRGMYVKKKPVRALALISVAVKNATDRERVWIEDVYQNIYCGASIGIRAKVDGTTVARWDRRYGRKPSLRLNRDLTALESNPRRVCQDGETPPLLLKELKHKPSKPRRKSEAISADARDGIKGTVDEQPNPATAHGFVSDGNVARGGSTGLGLFRNVGE